MKKIEKKALLAAVLLLLCFAKVPGVRAAEATDGKKEAQEAAALREEYRVYQERLDSVEKRPQIGENGFRVLEEQVFAVTLESLGEVTFVPALDERYHRLVLFFADGEDRIVYRTDRLAMNFVRAGSLDQLVQGLSAVSFQDVDQDLKTDIVLIASCGKKGQQAEKPCQVGEVLFAGENGFYRDFRISDKINRFGMNKSVDFILSYLWEGRSTEFLYTARTMKELSDNGFLVIGEQSYRREFEKLGRLLVVPGSITIADYDIFMIYLVNEDGAITWSFQPMGAHDNLYALRGIACRDIDGDGMKDLVVLARYSDETAPGQQEIVSDYEIYYQRTGGFAADSTFKKRFPCDENTKMEDLVSAARAYWGYVEEQEQDT